MQTKLFEIRDRATLIPVLAVNCDTSMDQREWWLLRKAGYACDGNNIVLLSNLCGGTVINYDPFNWSDRTYATAHEFITEHWDSLRSGDVVDVEFILGETLEVKISEQFDLE